MGVVNAGAWLQLRSNVTDIALPCAVPAQWGVSGWVGSQREPGGKHSGNVVEGVIQTGQKEISGQITTREEGFVF